MHFTLTSSPRRRGPRANESLGSRLRGNDEVEGGNDEVKSGIRSKNRN